MDKELILKREKENDGHNVYLYYNKDLGLYLGYGLSAYYTTSVLDPMASYSETMDIPIVMLKRRDILQLRQSMSILEHKSHCFYRLQTRNRIGNRWYDTWSEALKQHLK